MTSETLLRRIEELESQVAFLDELHESLNSIVAKQDGEILELKRQIGKLTDRLRDLGGPVAGTTPDDEVPPHY